MMLDEIDGRGGRVAGSGRYLLVSEASAPAPISARMRQPNLD